MAAAPSPLVVCSVDGTVYTLDAHTGRLRVLFSSGPPLFRSEGGPGGGDFGPGDGVGGGGGAGGPPADAAVAVSSGQGRRARERVVPGLDGRLYSLYETDGGVEGDRSAHGADGEDGACDDLDDGGECRERLREDGGDGDDPPDEPAGGDESSAALPAVALLIPLPISATDVVDAPISTCRPASGPDGGQQCGVIVGSKRTTIYACSRPVVGIGAVGAEGS